MNIIFACDNNYAGYLAVAIHSLFKHNHKPVQLFILDLGIGAVNRSLLEKMANRHGSTIRFIAVESSEFEHMPLTIQHISLASYARLKAADYLPSIDKAIYLDVDLLITGNLDGLWETDLQDNLVGACLDSFIESECAEYKARIGLSGSHPYFNAGVLLLNLKQWRAEQFFQRCEQWLAQHRDVIEYQDQCILNGVCKTRVHFLDTRYNFMPHTHFRIRKARKYHRPLHPLEQATMPIAIVHYCGNTKAWHNNCSHSYAWQFARHWNEVRLHCPELMPKPPKPSLGQRFKRWRRHFNDRVFYRMY